jgi:hypothetical protein
MNPTISAALPWYGRARVAKCRDSKREILEKYPRNIEISNKINTNGNSIPGIELEMTQKIFRYIPLHRSSKS